MRRWVTIGALVLIGAWAPFLYRELTSEHVAKKGTALVADERDDAPVEPAEPAGGSAAHPAGGEGEKAPTGPAQPDGPEGTAVADPKAEAPAEPAAEAPTAPSTAVAPTEPGGVKATTPEGAEGEPEEAPAPEPPVGSPATANAVFQHAFESEPRDALWAREAEARLVQVLTGAEVPIETIKTARCQKTVCRLELVWTEQNAVAYTNAYKGVRQEFGDELGVQHVGPGENEGERRIDLYVPRHGYTLADLSR